MHVSSSPMCLCVCVLLAFLCSWPDQAALVGSQLRWGRSRRKWHHQVQCSQHSCLVSSRDAGRRVEAAAWKNSQRHVTTGSGVHIWPEFVMWSFWLPSLLLLLNCCINFYPKINQNWCYQLILALFFLHLFACFYTILLIWFYSNASIHAVMFDLYLRKNKLFKKWNNFAITHFTVISSLQLVTSIHRKLLSLNSNPCTQGYLQSHWKSEEMEQTFRACMVEHCTNFWSHMEWNSSRVHGTGGLFFLGCMQAYRHLYSTSVNFMRLVRWRTGCFVLTIMWKTES